MTELEPIHKRVIMETVCRGRRLKIYGGRWAGDLYAGPDEVRLNGYVVSDAELDRGWVDTDALGREARHS